MKTKWEKFDDVASWLVLLIGGPPLAIYIYAEAGALGFGFLGIALAAGVIGALKS